ncbi:metallophosphoesterase family protein [Chryseobacterium sp. Mn2064]|uniref:metallophosphoesterase family protein n=1 Tax=Chryseobacterium sp. Mn2064 TaxID=3395263 RepID=UPI003BC7A51E
MIKIAIISDIHANIIALEEVLKDIEQREITQIYCLGDLVDFAPWGNETIHFIRKTGIPCLMGNHDQRIAFNQPITPLGHHNKLETRNRIKAIMHSKKNITEDNKNWLKSLPYNMELTFKTGDIEKKILLVHASLNSNDEYVYENDQKKEIIEQLNKREIDILVMGHTHHSYILEVDFKLIVNCGSVGRSKELDHQATYTILTVQEYSTSAEIIKLDYDTTQVAKAIYSSEIPDFYGDFFYNK